MGPSTKGLFGEIWYKTFAWCDLIDIDVEGLLIETQM